MVVVCDVCLLSVPVPVSVTVTVTVCRQWWWTDGGGCVLCAVYSDFLGVAVVCIRYTYMYLYRLMSLANQYFLLASTSVGSRTSPDL